MGWFTRGWEIKDSNAPARVVVRVIHLEHLKYNRDYVEDHVFDVGGHFEFKDTAWDRAHSFAKLVRTEGLRWGDTHYPVHRIKDVKVVPLEWKLEEKKND